jgi:hypothetical protein
VFQLCNAPEVVEFPTGSGSFWDPAAFKPPTLRQDSEGTIPRLDLTVTDVAGEILTWTERGDGFIGRNATLHVCARANLSSTANALSVTMKVAEVAANDEAVTFSLGLLSLLSFPFPRRTFNRDRCWHPFTGPGCFFQLPGVGQAGYADPLIMNCDKTLSGSGGCIVHGDNEVTRGLPRNHPLQFGGFPSIPMGARR